MDQVVGLFYGGLVGRFAEAAFKFATVQKFFPLLLSQNTSYY